jgi:SPP1 family predicted phage head-tail adaptor
VRQNEFYEAKQLGLKPQLMFVIRSIEFKNDERLKYKSKEYEIIRMYDKGETVELICGALNNG